MATTDLAGLALALLAGAALGLFFFGGLRWTLARSLRSDWPAAWQLASLLVRTGITVAGIALVGGGQWQRLLLALAGFTAARVLVVRAVRIHDEEAAHAPEP